MDSIRYPQPIFDERNNAAQTNCRLSGTCRFTSL
jgi:hypothetical protein